MNMTVTEHKIKIGNLMRFVNIFECGNSRGRVKCSRYPIVRQRPNYINTIELKVICLIYICVYFT